MEHPLRLIKKICKRNRRFVPLSLEDRNIFKMNETASKIKTFYGISEKRSVHTNMDRIKYLLLTSIITVNSIMKIQF